MRIAFIGQPLDRILPPSQNSIGIWIYEVARRLSAIHEVHVYSMGGLKRQKDEVRDGVYYHSIRAFTYNQTHSLQTLLNRIRPTYRPFYASPWFSLDYSLSAAIDLRRRKVDVVHIVNFSQFVPIVRAFNPNAKIVLHMQCEWLSLLDRSMIAERIKQTDLVLGCSEFITQKVRDRFPEYAHYCKTVFNGVDEASFAPPRPIASKASEPGPKRLLFVSRLSPEKGVHVLLAAFRKVCKYHPDTELELIGSPGSAPKEFLIDMSTDPYVAGLARFYENGSYMEHLKKEIPPELEKQVHFTGHLRRTEIIDHFHRADVLINPSLNEPFGMALVEGMASGIPVIAPRIGGMVEIIDDGVTGYVVRPDDANDLAAAIIRLLDNDDLRITMGKAGRQRVFEMFAWERIADRLLDQYQAICSETSEALSKTSQPVETQP